MALNWSWNEKVGEAILEQKNGEFKLSLYQGNAYLIFVSEFEEDGVEKYSVWSFWSDKAHAKRCLGLEKETDNIYSDGWSKIKKFRISKKCRHFADIIGMIAKGFDEIDIEIYS